MPVNVNRILGDDHPAGDFDSDSHILNAFYSGRGLEIGKITGYTYLLDLIDAPALSSATWGASFVGSTPVTDTMAATYHAEYAHQTDYQNSPLGSMPLSN